MHSKAWRKGFTESIDTIEIVFKDERPTSNTRLPCITNDDG